MERCPNCRARWDGGGTCRRCGMDLEPLVAVEAAADELLTQAIGQLAAENADEARRLLAHARALHYDELSELLYDFVKWSDAQGSDEPFLVGERASAADAER